jgi:hypothetical protein
MLGQTAMDTAMVLRFQTVPARCVSWSSVFTDALKRSVVEHSVATPPRTHTNLLIVPYLPQTVTRTLQAPISRDTMPRERTPESQTHLPAARSSVMGLDYRGL